MGAYVHAPRQRSILYVKKVRQYIYKNICSEHPHLPTPLVTKDSPRDLLHVPVTSLIPPPLFQIIDTKEIYR